MNLYPPSPEAQIELAIARPRLLALLDRDPRAPEPGDPLLIQAGPGWGKSVLLRQWAASTIERVAWVTARPGAPASAFSLAVGAALARASLAAPLVPGADFDAMALLHALETSVRAGTLIIDGAEHLTDPVATVTLEALLMGRSPVRVVVACRQEPGIRLLRLRLAGALRDITALDLAMTEDETAAALRAAGVDDAESTARSVLELTDGWPAAVGLLAAWRANRPNHPVSEDALTQAGVVDLVTEEVEGTWTEPDHHAARLLGCVAEFSGGLADAVCGVAGTTERLEAFQRRSASFLRRDEQRPQWFHFVAPVRLALQREFGALEPAQQQEVRARAARWFGGCGDWQHALEQAVAVADSRLLADVLIGGAFRGWFVDMARLRTWPAPATMSSPLHAAADELLVRASDANRAIRVASAAVKVQLHDPLAALASKRRGNSTAEDPATRLALRLTDLVIAHQIERESDVRLLSDKLVEDLGDDPVLAAAIRYHQADFCWAQGSASSHELDGLLNEAVTLAHSVDEAGVELSALQLRGVIEADASRLRRAAATVVVSASVARRSGLSLNARHHLARGLIALHRADLDACEAATQAAEAGVDQLPLALSGRPNTGLDGVRMLRLWCHLARGNIEATLTIAAELEQRLSVMPPRRRAETLLTLGELDIRSGRPKHALERLQAGPESNPWLLLTAAHAHITLGDAASAQRALDRIVRNPDVALPRNALAGAFLLEAAVADAEGDASGAVRRITNALDLAGDDAEHVFASARRLLHPVIERHPELATRWPKPSSGSPWIDLAADSRVLNGMSGSSSPVTVDADDDASSTTVRFTVREESVLQLLAAQMELQEIAERLCLSTNTAKTHVRAIYNKLGVGNRRDAVLRAHHLELL